MRANNIIILVMTGGINQAFMQKIFLMHKLFCDWNAAGED